MKRFLVVLCAGMAAFSPPATTRRPERRTNGSSRPRPGSRGRPWRCRAGRNSATACFPRAQAGFAYAPIRSDNTGSFTETTDVTVDGQVMSCRLTGLDAETSYLIYAFVDMGSGGRMQSKPVVVKTGVEPGVAGRSEVRGAGVFAGDGLFGDRLLHRRLYGRQRGIRGLFPLRDGDVGRRAARGGHDRTRRQERHAHGPERFDEV